jgi:hypothetical protein
LSDKSKDSKQFGKERRNPKLFNLTPRTLFRKETLHSLSTWRGESEISNIGKVMG